MKDFLDGSVCLVTGGTQGIGWALVQALAAHGATVYGCGYSQGSLDRANEELRTLPRREAIKLSRCDVTDRKALEGWLEEIYQETGRIDVLVNNAAYVRWVDIQDMSIEEASNTMRVSYEGMVVGIKSVLPLMEAAGQGHIINVGSLTARILVPGSSAAYAAAKAAVDAYTVMLNIELEKSPVNATLVRLSTVAGTNFFKKHVRPSRMAPLTKFLPALTPPVVAESIVKAIYRKQEVLTLPGYMHLLSIIYCFIPRLARRLARIGGRNEHDYGQVEWQQSGGK
jgi:NAD(P)-dependent dehydrogenase (short-subunit alcohol dehydrogenase family)